MKRKTHMTNVLAFLFAAFVLALVALYLVVTYSS